MDNNKALYNVATVPERDGEFAANGFGLYNVAGSVSEWGSDWFERAYYEKSLERNPRGPKEGLYMVIRGGASSDGPKRLKVFFRQLSPH